MKRRQIHKGRVVDLGMESVTLPNGEKLDLEVIRHPGGAAVVANDDLGRVCMIRQYRHAAGGWLWELPAGKIDPDETPESTARRELAEETGFNAEKLELLGKILTTPGFCDEIIYIYRATGLTPCPAQHEAHEVIEVHWINFEQAIDQIHDGTICDAKTIIGLMLARP